jgi:SAM-dependent methyltransferase
VDRETLSAYDRGASGFARDWHEQPAPDDLHALIRRFFQPGLTADIGCGSGRDVAWLVAAGFPAVGYDPSEGLLKEARTRYPQLEFKMAELPELTGIADNTFDNVMCETVIMHLDRDALAPAIRRLVTILKLNGVLYLSWRVMASDQRDKQGRLYAAVDKDQVVRALQGARILLDEEVVSASSGKTIQRIVARRTA